MITLKEAFEVTGIKDDEVVILKEYPAETNGGTIISTRKKIEENLGLETIKIHRICPWFVCGDYKGFEFVASGIGIVDGSTTVL